MSNEDKVKIECGPIVGPYTNRLDQSRNLGIGNQQVYFQTTTEWARIDKDLNLVHLDMDLCAKGPTDAYTTLGIGIWNAAIEEAAKSADHILTEGGGTRGDVIRRLKK